MPGAITPSSLVIRITGLSLAGRFVVFAVFAIRIFEPVLREDAKVTPIAGSKYAILAEKNILTN
jgi:hypothetical protein